MGQKTGIEWTESTWNPIRGCSRVSEGCRNCYAETVANRFKGPGEPYEGLIAKGGQWNGEVKLIEHKLDEPCRRIKPRMIFVNSMSDLFHPSVPFETIAGIFGIMAAASWHTFQVLTKRPERMVEFFQWIDQHPERKNFDTERLQNTYPGAAWQPFLLAQAAADILPTQGEGLRVDLKGQWPLQNVWLGVSVEDQATANERIPQLLETPAAVRWISAEPLLGPMIMDQFLFRGDHSLRESDPLAAAMLAEAVSDGHGWIRPAIDWVVVGGESGPRARPMHPDWARYLRDRCQAAEVPFLFKQWGEWAPETVCATEHGARTALFIEQDGSTRPAAFGARGQATTVQKNGKKQTGRNLDGRTWDQYPEATQ
jgi:protein gp37